MYCRGTETRQKIVKEYFVKPEVHIKLLNGQHKHSDAEAVIKDEYYIFSAKRKSDGGDEQIICGMGAARDFLNILGHPGLPLFNPLHEECRTTFKSISKQNNGEYKRNDSWNETAEQLYNAIMWLIIAWDAKPNTLLFLFKDEIIKYKKFNPYDSKIKRVNTLIANGGKGRTLTEIINGYSANNNIKINLCDFSLLKKRMEKITDKDGNKLKSFF